ncbi:hypothetical protein F0562_010183 [Nyssa sinensis]|uniref:Uncharacterized protein n=1 Tax=Nyssa sinensis TaxID=561372 RepID=A0A5J4ZZV2_9ASTE|nr:hypothetical protein F0562_010183 [Nyssa sinensis]
MRFFLEFVSCCGYACRSSDPTATPSPPPDETRSLVHSPPPSQPNTCRYRRRKRGRVAVSRSGSVVEWRPSLGAISEDNVVPEKERPEAVRSERILKRKVASTARVHVRTYSDDIGRTPLRAIIPAFSPTPFLF